METGNVRQECDFYSSSVVRRGCQIRNPGIPIIGVVYSMPIQPTRLEPTATSRRASGTRGTGTCAHSPSVDRRANQCRSTRPRTQTLCPCLTLPRISGRRLRQPGRFEPKPRKAFTLSLTINYDETDQACNPTY